MLVSPHLFLSFSLPTVHFSVLGPLAKVEGQPLYFDPLFSVN